ncbi:putative serine/threonine protein phosphatase [Acinetobacter phage KARL-1]|uniref:Putative serine/threonine protein phosphatase n=1 Tax=Acinetobacter phage KARL-1 TaxID=2301662 RepID=A0A385IIS9_9CAUD|nr:phosphoesterase [Acinetobacter phage KARL-1]AXY82796.1 putative serine/threonine protein phosphatase [Acinetobacter phage KARL-1]
MANVLFYGDLHAGHKAIAKYRTRFRDEQDHFEHVEREYYNAVTKRDVCYFTGDAVFSLERARQIAKWPGKKILICGNHDTDNLTMQQLCETFDEVAALRKYKEFWLSHAPLHPVELRGKINIHGHVHFATLDDCRYVNTSLENTDYKPIALYQIRDIIKARKHYYASIYDSISGSVSPEIRSATRSIYLDIHSGAYAIPKGLK